MRNKPNMNVLLLLTQRIGDKNQEKLIFLYRRPINDYSDSGNAYWSWKGKANKLSGQLHLNQRLAFCNDEEAESIFNSIIKDHVAVINKNKINIQVPKVTQKDIKDKHGILSHVFYYCDSLNYFPAELSIEENWDMLCGYGGEQTNFIKPIGLLTPKQLLIYITSNKIAVNLQRETSISFRGARNKSIKGKGSKQIIGFVRDVFEDSSKYTISVSDMNDKINGKAVIDKRSGLFNVQLNGYLASGNLKYHINKELRIYIEFSLVQDIVINMSIVTSTMKDAYGRQFHRAEKE